MWLFLFSRHLIPLLFGNQKIAMGIGFVIGVVGGLLLAHAAYATVQCNKNPNLISDLGFFFFFPEIFLLTLMSSADRGVLKIVEEEFSGPPINVRSRSDPFPTNSWFHGIHADLTFRSTGRSWAGSRVMPLLLGSAYRAGEVPFNTSWFWGE